MRAGRWDASTALELDTGRPGVGRHGGRQRCRSWHIPSARCRRFCSASVSAGAGPAASWQAAAARRAAGLSCTPRLGRRLGVAERDHLPGEQLELVEQALVPLHRRLAPGRAPGGLAQDAVGRFPPGARLALRHGRRGPQHLRAGASACWVRHAGQASRPPRRSGGWGCSALAQPHWLGNWLATGAWRLAGVLAGQLAGDWCLAAGWRAGWLAGGATQHGCAGRGTPAGGRRRPPP